MKSRFHRTLKFQLLGAILSIALLTGLNSWYTTHLVDHQARLGMVMQLADRMQLAAQWLTIQGMAYQENPARDYATYQRDLKLYYNDLLSHIQVFDQVLSQFMEGGYFSSDSDFGMPGRLRLGAEVRRAIEGVRARWKRFRDELDERIGPDPSMPRLEWAAGYIIAHHQQLDDAIARLIEVLRERSSAQSAALRDLNRALVAAVLILTALIVLWLYRTVIRPISRTASEMRRIAQGDFGKQLSLPPQLEPRELAEGFNTLSTRLDTLFRIIGQLQQGDTLEEVLNALAGELPSLLPLDWLGILFVTADGTTIKLEHALCLEADGPRPEALTRSHFRYRETLLWRALRDDRLIHVSPIDPVAGRHPEYEFLNHLRELGLHDAIFVPLHTGAATPAGVLAIASRRPRVYTEEHLRLLHNLRVLLSHGVGKTLKLVQQAHLASVGRFASGIAHELRNPLATVRLALDYLDQQDLAPQARRRLNLASAETNRISRLLEDILLYAKPLHLDLKPLRLESFVAAFLRSHAALARDKQQHCELAPPPRDAALIAGDSDRLTQVLLNLHLNAIQAAPVGATIHWRLDCDTARGIVTLQVTNPGEPIPVELLGRIAQPFVTTRAEGTGLGLSIVKRLVEAHGGELRIQSDADHGTRVSLRLPLLPEDTPETQ